MVDRRRHYLLRYRILIGLAAAALIYATMPSSLSHASRFASAWVVLAAVQLIIIFQTIGVHDSGKLRAWAQEVEPTRTGFAAFLIAGAAMSITASILVLQAAEHETELLRLVHLLLGAGTVLVTWFTIQTIFAVRYAYMYYGGGTGIDEPGLSFPNEPAPNFWDFLYFAVCAGMTFEASDVSVTLRSFRKWVTFQAVFSFIFTSINLALLVDIAATLI